MFSNEELIGQTEQEIIIRGWTFCIEFCTLCTSATDDPTFECHQNFPKQEKLLAIGNLPGKEELQLQVSFPALHPCTSSASSNLAENVLPKEFSGHGYHIN